MPTYTVRKVDGEGEEWDIRCSHKELLEVCEEYGLERVLKPVGFITQAGSTIGKTSGDWRDFLKKVDKNAGMRSKVKNY